MCIAFLAFHHVPGLPLVLAANRDEFYPRATAPMDFWSDAPNILAGRDLQGGGTWLGVNRLGKLAFLTNYREPDTPMEQAPSRGGLITSFLSQNPDPKAFSRNLEARGHVYNGFNLVFGSVDGLWHYSNRSNRTTPLEPGIHGLSNHLLNTPWPKVERGKNRMAALQKDRWTHPLLFDLLQDSHHPPDHQLPQTGVGLEWERLLSPIFIQSAHYGTRSGTVLTVDQNSAFQVTERSYRKSPDQFEQRNFRFQVSQPDPT